MTYTRLGPFHDGTGGPFVSAATFNHLEDGITAANQGLIPNAIGDGTADDTTALQTAINTVRDAVRSTSMGVQNTVTVPAGKYKISSTLILPPYVRLKSAGTVVLLWTGTTGPAIWISPLADDPATLYPPIHKQQWQDAPLLNGADGGFILINQGAGTSVGIELGSRTDLSGVALSRYVLTDFAIQDFGTGMQWNAYNHYIGRFVNAHIENNATGIAIGAGGVNTNSGENMVLSRSIIAGASTAVAVNTYGFDVTYDNCSIDFIYGTVIALGYGYARHLFLGGHIEYVNPTNTAGAGIVNSTSTTEAHVRFEGTTVLVNAAKQFLGTNLTVSGAIYFSGYDTDHANIGYLAPVLADDQVIADDFTQLQRGNRRLFSRTTNLLDDPFWDGESVGSKSTLIDWTISAGTGVTLSIVADSPETSGAKSLHIVMPTNTYCALTYKNSILTSADKSAQWSYGGFYTDTVGMQFSSDLQLLGWDGVVVANTGQVAFYLATTATSGSWQMPNYMNGPANRLSFNRNPYVRPIFIFANSTASTMTVRVPFLYFGR